MKTVGRPTKYDEKMLTKARAYVQRCQNDKEMPFIEELALTLDVNDDSIVEWAKEHDEFSATVKRLKMLQKLQLKRGALEKRLHPSLAVFLLKANHGMNEDQKEPESPLSVHVHYIGKDPKTLDDAIANKEWAIDEQEKAEKAIEEFTGTKRQNPIVQAIIDAQGSKSDVQ